MQHSKKEIMLLKLDFAKAFDTIEHEAMIDIMKSMGFNDKWLSWIRKKIPLEDPPYFSMGCRDDNSTAAMVSDRETPSPRSFSS